MHAILYVVVAGAAILLGVRALRPDPTASSAKDFALLAIAICVTFLSFSLLSVEPNADWIRMFYVGAGACLPAANLGFLEHFFSRAERSDGSATRALWLTGGLVGVGYGTLFVFLEQTDRPGWPEWIAGVLVFAAFGASLVRLWQIHERAESWVERQRIRYLFILMALAVGLSALEGFVRVNNPAAADAQSSANPFTRAQAVQGLLPPVGALFSGLYLYFLYQVQRRQRLLDLSEIATRLMTIGVMASVYTAIVGLADLWVYPDRLHVLQSTFMVFVASMCFLVLSPGLLDLVESRIGPLFNKRGFQLHLAIDELNRDIFRRTSSEELSAALVDRLHASGRVTAAAIYLWTPSAQQFRLVASRAGDGAPDLTAVAAQPFTESFENGTPLYVRQELTTLSLRNPEEATALLGIMDGINADLVLPIRSGETLLGWLALKDEEWSDGFSREEIAQLRQTLGRVAVAMENIRGFEASRDQARLAALGTMAAGLAHEIRNPLAGIKGAAQFLHGLQAGSSEREMLEVITNEVDRLNTVVTGFLDYARHLELRREPTDLNQLVAQVLALVRAQGFSDKVQIREQLSGGLPPVAIDGDKLRQVVLNLLQNAIFAVRDGGEVRVSTSLSEVAGPRGTRLRSAELAISDNGEGLTREAQQNLFVPFFTTKAMGTGLGLAISQRIVRAHEGELRVESRSGYGATFVVSLPLPPEQADPAALSVRS